MLGILFILSLIIITQIVYLNSDLKSVKRDIDGLDDTVRSLSAKFRGADTQEIQKAEPVVYSAHPQEYAPEPVKEVWIEPEPIANASVQPEPEPAEEPIEESFQAVVEEEIFESEAAASIIQEAKAPVSTESSYIHNQENEEPWSFEKAFMGNIFNKIGALALIIGFGIFLKIVSSYIVFTPLMKIMTGFIAGLAMIYGSVKLHKDQMKSYAEVLMGTGISILFVTTYCAAGFFNILPAPTAIVIGILLTIASYFMAEKYKSFSTIAIGVFGGYLTPFLINANISTNFLFSYLIFVNLVSLVYVYKNQDKIAVNFINLVMTAFTITVFSTFGEKPNIILPIIFWAMYLLNDLFMLKNEVSRETGDVRNILLWVNYIVLMFFANYVFGFENREFIGFVLLFAGFIYGVCAFYIDESKVSTARQYLSGSLISILFMTYFMFSDTARVWMWSLEAIIVTYFSRTHKYFKTWILAFYFPAFTAMFFLPDIMFGTNQAYILNPRLLLLGGPIVSAFIAAKILPEEDKKLSEFFRFFYISLMYIFATLEINTYFTKNAYATGAYDLITFTKVMCYTILGFIYALQTKRLYISTQMVLFNAASYFIYIVAMVMLLCMGCTYPDAHTFFVPIANIRFLAYIAAIAATLMYRKWTKEEVFTYLAILLGFLLTTVEMKDLMVKMYISNNGLLMSTAWIIYSGILMMAGIFKNWKPLKISGIWIAIITILKILFYDLAGVEAIYKVIAFLSLGVILMIVSYFYTKNKGQE